MSDIDPLNLPKGAGLDQNGGDVRHLSPDDSLDHASVSRATRNLAKRDDLIKEKVNELVSVVNNKEQIISVPLVRTTLPPGATEVTNYRIPSGFEARLLNTSVSSTPAGIIRLNVYHGTGFGGTSGTELSSTTGESEAQTKFYGVGEFIVEFTNIGGQHAEFVGSVMLTMRPVGSNGTVITAGSTASLRGPQGLKGEQGSTGATGPTGPAGAGVTWLGPYAGTNTYARNSLVSFPVAVSGGGTKISTYIANLAAGAGTTPANNTAVWNVFAEGATGTAGGDGSDGSGGGQTISVFENSPPGTIKTEWDFVAGVSQNGYNRLSEGTQTPTFTEYRITNGVSAGTLLFMRYSQYLNFTGAALIELPSQAWGALADWQVDEVNPVVRGWSGSFIQPGSLVQLIPLAGNKMRVYAPQQQNVQLSLTGFRTP